jgi:hypothetical protein
LDVRRCFCQGEVLCGSKHHLFKGALRSNHRLSPEPANTPRS